MLLNSILFADLISREVTKEKSSVSKKGEYSQGKSLTFDSFEWSNWVNDSKTEFVYLPDCEQ